MDILYAGAGLFLLFLGGESLVRGALGVALRFRLPAAVAGAVVVGFGTSLPELVASLEAVRVGSAGIAVGNVVGSNIANILLICGIGAVLAPIAIGRTGIRRDCTFLVLATAALVPLAALGALHQPWSGIILILGLCAYLALSLRADGAGDETAGIHPKFWRDAILVLAGLACLMVGAWLLIEGSVSLARGFGVSEAMIGATLVAVGTSLPELATTIVAVVRKQGDLAVGNIVGSNIFNVFAILGICALADDIPFPAELLPVHLAMFVASGVLFAVYLLGMRRIERAHGVGFLTAYSAYVAGAYWLERVQNVSA